MSSDNSKDFDLDASQQLSGNDMDVDNHTSDIEQDNGSNWFTFHQVPVDTNIDIDEATSEMGKFWDTILTAPQINSSSDTSAYDTLIQGEDFIDLPMVQFPTNRVKLTVYMPNFLYVRESYRTAYDAIFKLTYGYALHVSGIPGVGKSVFGIYFVLRYLLERISEKGDGVVLLCGVDKVAGWLFGVGKAPEPETIGKVRDSPLKFLVPFMEDLRENRITMMNVKDPCKFIDKLNPCELFGWEKAPAKCVVVCDPGMFEDHTTPDKTSRQVSTVGKHYVSGEQVFLLILSDQNQENIDIKVPILGKIPSQSLVEITDWSQEEKEKAKSRIINYVKVPEALAIKGLLETYTERFYHTHDEATDEEKLKERRRMRPFKSLLEEVENIAERFKEASQHESTIRDYEQQTAEITIKAKENAEQMLNEIKGDFVEYRFRLFGGEVREWMGLFGVTERLVLSYLLDCVNGVAAKKPDKYTNFRKAPEGSLLHQFNAVLEEIKVLKEQYDKYSRNSNAIVAYLDLENLWSAIWTRSSASLNVLTLQYAFGNADEWSTLKFPAPIFSRSEVLGMKTLSENFEAVTLRESVYYSFSYVKFPVIDALGITANDVFGQSQCKYKVLFFQTTGGATHKLDVKIFVKQILALRKYLGFVAEKLEIANSTNQEINVDTTKQEDFIKSLAFYYVVNCGLQESFRFKQNQSEVIARSLAFALNREAKVKVKPIHYSHQDFEVKCIKVGHRKVPVGFDVDVVEPRSKKRKNNDSNL